MRVHLAIFFKRPSNNGGNLPASLIHVLSTFGGAGVKQDYAARNCFVTRGSEKLGVKTRVYQHSLPKEREVNWTWCNPNTVPSS